MKSKAFYLLVIMTLLFQPCFLSSFPVKTEESFVQEKLEHEVHVVLKLIRVYVNDKKGNPIKNLEKSDFILFDNGKRQDVAAFERHKLNEPVKSEKFQETKPAVPRDVPQISNRKFIFILDYYRNDPTGIKRAKKAALHFIDTQMLPEDEVAVFSYSSLKGLVLHNQFTSDLEKAKNAIERARGVPMDLFGAPESKLPPQKELLDNTTANYLKSGALVDGRQVSADFGTTLVEADRDWERVKAINFAQQMGELAKYLRYVPGHKNAVFFSAGVPRNIFYDNYEPEFRDFYRQASQEFASANVPVFTVDTAGMRAWLFNQGGPDGRDVLRFLSDQSGGSYFHEVNYYKTIAEDIQKATSNFYVLGYYVKEKWDGQYHDIRVVVDRKNCFVEAQKGYFNPKPFDQFSALEKNLHLIDLALNEAPDLQDPVDLPSVSLSCSNRDEYNVIFLSEIPMGKIRELVRPHAEMGVFVLDRERHIVHSARDEFDFSKISRDVFYNYSILSLPPGDYECKLVLRNLSTGKGATGSSFITVAEAPEPGIHLYPPVLMIPDKKSLWVKISKKEQETEMPSMSDLFRFFSDKHTPILNSLEVDEGTIKILAFMRAFVTQIQNHDIELKVTMTEESSGQKPPLNFSLLSAEKHKEIDMLLLEIELFDLTPGMYTIEFEATDTSTGIQSKTSRTLRIKD